MVMWVFLLPKEIVERKVSACWLLWASNFPLLGLSFLICKMVPRAEVLSHLVAGRMRQMWACVPGRPGRLWAQNG